MRIEGISLSKPMQELLPQSQSNANTKGGNDGLSFKHILSDLMDASQAASAESREKTAQLLTGTLEDFPEYLIAGEKAGILFDLNLTVRNKVLDAYHEIMKTQV